jgi:hypothetical protein
VKKNQAKNFALGQTVEITEFKKKLQKTTTLNACLRQ